MKPCTHTSQMIVVCGECATQRLEAAERERDEASESCRRMHGRLQRLIDGGAALRARNERLEGAIQTTLRKFPTWALDDLRAALSAQGAAQPEPCDMCGHVHPGRDACGVVVACGKEAGFAHVPCPCVWSLAGGAPPPGAAQPEPKREKRGQHSQYCDDEMCVAGCDYYLKSASPPNAAERCPDCDEEYTEHDAAAFGSAPEPPSSSELQKQGGEWLVAARNWIKWHRRNGERVTWGSHDVLDPAMTVADVEDLASEVAAAAIRSLRRAPEGGGR